jgi:aspartate/methionine/tyrosine aminotransferase
MDYQRMAIEVESPEELGYSTIQYNLAESSVTDRRLGDLGVELGDLVLGYASHRGNPALREVIAAQCQVSAEDVLIAPGAAAALFIVNTALLGGNAELLVVRPNYATNLEVPRTLRSRMRILDLRFENGYRLDLDEVAGCVTPETKLISVTYPHNPTGVVTTETELRALIALAEERGCYLLVDETYRDLHHGAAAPPLAASLSSRAISVSSVSKAYGLPGIRIGWIVSKDENLQRVFLAAKEQIVLCGSVVDEEIALHVLRSRDALLREIRAQTAVNFAMVAEWMGNQPELEWIVPAGGVVCFPRIREEALVDVQDFYQILIDEYSTCVGPGHWFEQSARHFRLGFGWEPEGKLRQGLENITQTLAKAKSNSRGAHIG